MLIVSTCGNNLRTYSQPNIKKKQYSQFSVWGDIVHSTPIVPTCRNHLIIYSLYTQWLGSNSVRREDLNSLNIYPHLPFISFVHLQYLSYSTNTEGVLLCSTRFIVLSGTGFLYLAVNRQGKIVYNLPCIPPIIYRVIFQLAFVVGNFMNAHRVDLRK